jgi:hypothetical protein
MNAALWAAMRAVDSSIQVSSFRGWNPQGARRVPLCGAWKRIGRYGITSSGAMVDGIGLKTILFLAWWKK